MRRGRAPGQDLRQRRVRPGQGHPQLRRVLRPRDRQVEQVDPDEEDVRVCGRGPHRPPSTLRVSFRELNQFLLLIVSIIVE